MKLAINLNFGLRPHQLPYFVFRSSDGSGETMLCIGYSETFLIHFVISTKTPWFIWPGCQETIFGVGNQVIPKPACSATVTS